MYSIINTMHREIRADFDKFCTNMESVGIKRDQILLYWNKFNRNKEEEKENVGILELKTDEQTV